MIDTTQCPPGSTIDPGVIPCHSRPGEPKIFNTISNSSFQIIHYFSNNRNSYYIILNNDDNRMRFISDSIYLPINFEEELSFKNSSNLQSMALSNRQVTT